MLIEKEGKLVWEDNYGNRVPRWLFNPHDKENNVEWLRAYKNKELFLVRVE